MWLFNIWGNQCIYMVISWAIITNFPPSENNKSKKNFQLSQICGKKNDENK